MGCNQIKINKRKAGIVLRRNDVTFSHMKTLGLGFAAGASPVVFLKLTGDLAFISWPILLLFPVIFTFSVFALLILLLMISEIYRTLRCKIKKDCDENSSHGS